MKNLLWLLLIFAEHTVHAAIPDRGDVKISNELHCMFFSYMKEQIELDGGKLLYTAEEKVGHYSKSSTIYFYSLSKDGDGKYLIIKKVNDLACILSQGNNFKLNMNSISGGK